MRARKDIKLSSPLMFSALLNNRQSVKLLKHVICSCDRRRLYGLDVTIIASFERYSLCL